MKFTAPEKFLFLWVLVSLILGIFIASDFGVSMDEDVVVARSKAALDLYLGDLQEDPLLVFNSFDNPNGKYYGTASDMPARVLEQFVFPQSAHATMAVSHYVYFVFFQLAAVSLYYLARLFFSDWISLVVALLMGTQPLLFGHGFINPKDIPLLALFTLTVVCGFYLVDGWLQDAQQRDDVSAGREPSRVRRERLFWLVLGLAVVIFWSGPLISRLAKDLVEYSFQNKGSGLLGKTFAAMTTSGSLEGYRVLAHLWTLRTFRFILLAGTLFLIGLFRWSTQNELFARRADWRLLLAAGVWGFAVSTRSLAIAAGGIVGIYGLVKLGRAAIQPLAIYTLTASLSSVLSWPFLWVFGIRGLIDSLLVFSNYDWVGGVLFEGQIYGPHDLPARYLPETMMLQFTEPLVILALAGFILAMILIVQRRLLWIKSALLLVWFVLPIVYTALAHSTVYDNFRQYLFITPPLFIFAGFSLNKLFEWIRPSLWRVVIAILILLPGIVSIIQLHPGQYFYYNQFAGGIEGASGQYPLDYWNILFLNAMDHINQEAAPGSRILIWKDTDLASIYADKRYVFGSHEVVAVEQYSSFDYAIMSSGRYQELPVVSESPVLYTVSIGGVDILDVLKISSDANR